MRKKFFSLLYMCCSLTLANINQCLCARLLYTFFYESALRTKQKIFIGKFDALELKKRLKILYFVVSVKHAALLSAMIKNLCSVARELKV